MGVSELLSVEAELTDAVEGGFVCPVVASAIDSFENVSRLGTVGIEIEVTVPADELVTSEGFDGFDCFLDFHGCFIRKGQFE